MGGPWPVGWLGGSLSAPWRYGRQGSYRNRGMGWIRHRGLLGPIKCTRRIPDPCALKEQFGVPADEAGHQGRPIRTSDQDLQYACLCACEYSDQGFYDPITGLGARYGRSDPLSAPLYAIICDMHAICILVGTYVLVSATFPCSRVIHVL